MNNHVHLLMETKENSFLSKTMQGINLAYTICFNGKNGKVGHLWQDRYKSAFPLKWNATHPKDLGSQKVKGGIAMAMKEAITLFGYHQGSSLKEMPIWWTLGDVQWNVTSSSNLVDIVY